MITIRIPKLLTGLFCLFCTPLFGQSITFKQVYGDQGQDMASDVLELPDGYLISGETFNPTNGHTDALLVRLDKNGAVLWKKTYGQFEHDGFELLARANDGGFIAWGSTRNFNLDRSDAWLVKLDDAGNLLWQKTVGEPGFSEYPSGKIIAVPDGYILSGTKSNPGYSQAFVLKVGNSGQTLWSRFITTSGYSTMRASFVSDSLLYLAGTANGLGSWKTMDPVTGALVQSYEYLADTTNWLYRIHQTPEGNRLLTGEIIQDIPGLIRFKGWAQKVNPAGQVIWSKSYKIGDVNGIYASELLADGSCILTLTYIPYLNSGLFYTALIKIDPNGAVVWTKNFGSTRTVFIGRIVPTTDGGFFAAGFTEADAVPNIDRDAFWMKTDSLGNLEGCCSAEIQVLVEDVPVTPRHEPVNDTTFENTVPFSEAIAGPAPLDVREYCPNTPPEIKQSILLCSGESVTLGDSTYTQPATVVLTLPSTTGGCDTSATYTIATQARPTLEQTIPFCPGDTVLLGGAVFTQPGIFTVLLPAPTGGCDTLATITLEYLPQPTVQQTIVFSAGDTVTIGGNAYTQPGTVYGSIPSLTSGCDTLLVYTLVSDTPACVQALSFLKRFEQGPIATAGRIILPATGGGVYIFGEIQAYQGPKLAKTDTSGNILWLRRLDFLAPDLPYSFNMIEDSDGFLVGFGNYTDDNAPNNTMYAFRYNPATDEVLWYRHFAANQYCTANGLVEAAAGGNFLLYDHVQPDADKSNSEIWQLDRLTGALVAGRIWRYDTNVQLRAARAFGGAVYATGVFADPATGAPGFGIAKIEAGTGTPLWTKITQAGTPGLEGQDIAIDSGGWLIAMANQGQAIWVQKSTIDGNLLWLRRFEMPGALASGFYAASLVVMADGYAITAYSTRPDGNKSMILMKISPDGVLVWAKELKYAGSGGAAGGRQSLSARGAGLFFVAQYQATPFENKGLWLGKTDGSGQIGGDCTALTDVALLEYDAQAGQLPATLTRTPPTRSLTNPGRTGTSAEPSPFLALCTACKPPCADILSAQSISFYPGQSITLGGQTYNQPGTVALTKPAPNGCDSVITYTLAFIPTALNIACPAALTTTLGPAGATVAINYPLPSVATDCPGPAPAPEIIQGLPSGGQFPAGSTAVCFQAVNACGNRDTCCFTVTVLPAVELPCDVKAPAGCLRYELLRISQDASGQRRYRVRVINQCASPLNYTCIQLPDGVAAVVPADGAAYQSPAGNIYAVRNPNASPFHSIRFKTVAGVLNNGKSDVFEFRLPQQSAPEYLRIYAKLADGSASEAHLNTFNCPVAADADQAVAERGTAGMPAGLRVFPNPAAAGARLTIVGGDIPEGVFILQDIAGKTIWHGPVLNNEVLPGNAGLPAGLYFFKIMKNGQPAGSGKWVVE